MRRGPHREEGGCFDDTRACPPTRQRDDSSDVGDGCTISVGGRKIGSNEDIWEVKTREKNPEIERCSYFSHKRHCLEGDCLIPPSIDFC